MVGKMFKIKQKKVLLTIILTLGTFFILLGLSLYKNEYADAIIFEVVEQDTNSKHSLVKLSNDNKKILATFDNFNNNFGKVLHKNDFWSPLACAAMPNLFLSGNYLTILDIKKGVEADKNTANIFVYNYGENLLKKSLNIKYLVGDLYTKDKKNAIFFTYHNQKLVVNLLDPSNLSVRKLDSYHIKEQNPTFRFYEIDKSIYIKILSESGIKNYEVNGSNLKIINEIPNRVFWNVMNERDAVVISKNGTAITLNKEDNENYKTLKVSDAYIVFSKLNMSNFYDFAIQVLDIKSEELVTIYSNNSIENNYYVISAD